MWCVYLLLDSTLIFGTVDIKGHERSGGITDINIYAKCLPSFHHSPISMWCLCQDHSQNGDSNGNSIPTDCVDPLLVGPLAGSLKWPWRLWFAFEFPAHLKPSYTGKIRMQLRHWHPLCLIFRIVRKIDNWNLWLPDQVLGLVCHWLACLWALTLQLSADEQPGSESDVTVARVEVGSTW